MCSTRRVVVEFSSNWRLYKATTLPYLSASYDGRCSQMRAALKGRPRSTPPRSRRLRAKTPFGPVGKIASSTSFPSRPRAKFPLQRRSAMWRRAQTRKSESMLHHCRLPRRATLRRLDRHLCWGVRCSVTMKLVGESGCHRPRCLTIRPAVEVRKAWKMWKRGPVVAALRVRGLREL